MAVPTGTASMLDIQNEFGGSNPISLSEYYGVVAGIPASGTISINDFRGKSFPTFQHMGTQTTNTSNSATSGYMYGDYPVSPQAGDILVTSICSNIANGVDYPNGFTGVSNATYKWVGSPYNFWSTHVTAYKVATGSESQVQSYYVSPWSSGGGILFQVSVFRPTVTLYSNSVADLSSTHYTNTTWPSYPGTTTISSGSASATQAVLAVSSVGYVGGGGGLTNNITSPTTDVINAPDSGGNPGCTHSVAWMSAGEAVNAVSTRTIEGEVQTMRVVNYYITFNT